MHSFFVTGTDTDVGKTLVTCALLHGAHKLKLDTLALKPIAAGCELIDKQLRNADALALQAAMTAQLDYQHVNPIALEPAIAPHIAAQQAQLEINLDELIEHTRQLQRRDEDVLFIEGAGGWLVPLNSQHTLAEYAKELMLPVILVVDMRLGCLNHALLTQASIHSMGLDVVGWVANTSQPEKMNCYVQNLQTLRQLIKAPCLGEIPYQHKPCPKQLAEHLNLQHLFA